MNSPTKGLSLIEVMIALVIVAVLAGVSYPRFQKMVTRSKQTEVKTVLRSMYMAQDLHKTTTLSYTDNLDDLDISLPEDAKYSYSLETGESNSTFLIKATANIDSDATIDEWQIDENNTLNNTVNDVIE